MPRSWANEFPIPQTRLVSEFRGDYNAMLDGALSCHIGPEEPPQLFNGMLWLDTSSSPALFRQRKSDGSGWATRAEADTDYGGALPLDGGTMRGAIDMDGFAITGLPAGSDNAPARYADLTPYAKVDGSVAFTGAVTLPGSNPTQDNHAARKLYVDTKAVAGGAFTGQINMTVAPSASDHVMRKSDVDTLFNAHNHTGGSNGPKIQFANLATTGLAADTLAVANGTNGVALKALPYVKLYDGPISIVADQTMQSFFGTQTQGTWATVDLSAHVSSEARGAILQVSMSDAVGAPARLYVRRSTLTTPTGSAINLSVPVYGIVGNGYTNYEGVAEKVEVIVPLDSFRRVDVAVKGTSIFSAARMSLVLIGEF